MNFFYNLIQLYKKKKIIYYLLQYTDLIESHKYQVQLFPQKKKKEKKLNNK